MSGGSIVSLGFREPNGVPRSGSAAKICNLSLLNVRCCCREWFSQLKTFTHPPFASVMCTQFAHCSHSACTCTPWYSSGFYVGAGVCLPHIGRYIWYRNPTHSSIPFEPNAWGEKFLFSSSGCRDITILMHLFMSSCLSSDNEIHTPWHLDLLLLFS